MKLARYFKSPPSAKDLDRTGFYRGEFVGPWWMTASAPLFTRLTGLTNWQGKRFANPGLAVKVPIRKGQTCDGPTMIWVDDDVSRLDSKTGGALQCGREAPIPWRWITDELRQVDDNTLLGMSVVNFPLVKYMPIPFLLVRKPCKWHRKKNYWRNTSMC